MRANQHLSFILELQGKPDPSIADADAGFNPLYHNAQALNHVVYSGEVKFRGEISFSNLPEMQRDSCPLSLGQRSTLSRGFVASIPAAGRGPLTNVRLDVAGRKQRKCGCNHYTPRKNCTTRTVPSTSTTAFGSDSLPMVLVAPESVLCQ